MSNLSGIVPCEQYDIFRPEGFQQKKNISSAIKLSHIFTVFEGFYEITVLVFSNIVD